MIGDVSDVEKTLRERIRAGTAGIEDYVDLADILTQRGELPESLTIVKQALTLDLNQEQRGLVLYQEAHLASLTAGQDDEVVALAEQSLSLLGDEQKKL
jgi:hypothetical protein